MEVKWCSHFLISKLLEQMHRCLDIALLVICNAINSCVVVVVYLDLVG
jgi:hypothetical protein